jgi:hypothetical protein
MMIQKFMFYTLPIFIVSGISSDMKIPEPIGIQKKETVSFRELKDTGIENINFSYFDFAGEIPNKKRLQGQVG